MAGDSRGENLLQIPTDVVGAIKQKIAELNALIKEAEELNLRVHIYDFSSFPSLGGGSNEVCCRISRTEEF